MKRGRKPKSNNISPIQLSELDIFKITKYIEWKEDPIKFIEECVYLPEAGGDVLFKLYEPQKRILRSFFNNHHLILLKSRQTGFSTLLQAICVYISIFHNNVIVGVASKSGSEASDFAKKTVAMLEKLEAKNKWLFSGFRTCNTQSFTLKNGCQFHSSAISPSNPGGLFRGKSISVLIIDEAAHIAKVDDAWTGVAPATSKAQTVAREKNIPFGTVIISTPNKTNGIGKFYYQTWLGAKSKENIFTAETIHWKDIDIFANDPNWYNNQCKLLNNDKRKIAQELDLKFVGDESSLFSEDIQQKLQEIRGTNRIPLPVGFGRAFENLIIDVYGTIDKGKFFIIGVDTASASGKDFSAVEIIESTTMKQVAEFKGKMEPKKFAGVVKAISKMFPNNIIVVENSGGYGLTVLNELTMDEDETYNVFGEKRADKFVYGLSTNTRTRPLILDALYNYVTESIECIQSENLALELLALTSKNNKIQADVGFNDDLCMSLGFALYVKTYTTETLHYDDYEDYDDYIETEGEVSNILAMNKYNKPGTKEFLPVTQFNNVTDVAKEMARLKTIEYIEDITRQINRQKNKDQL